MSDTQKLTKEPPKLTQEEIFQKANKYANYYANKMKQAVDQHSFDEGLHQASQMLSELRTAELTPKNYYSLYLDIVRKLLYLEEYFESITIRAQKPLFTCKQLYERVQYVGNIVPRLYLMITAGSVYIKSKETSAVDIIKDLVEMCKGVQHPTRGLFLRLYMSQRIKDKLPDKNGEYGTDVEKSIKYILENFADTVNLFSRLKGDWKGKKREEERKQLRTLIGQNLERLSNLEGLTSDLYKNDVLPKVMEIITKYKDSMSQEYLMICVVSAFPDEFHILTLSSLLDACTKLHFDVNLKIILTSLMNRLQSYARTFPQNIPKEFNMVRLFSEYVQRIASEKIEVIDFIEIQNALLGLSMNIYKNEINFVNTIVESICSKVQNRDIVVNDESVSSQLLSLLTATIVESFDSVLSVLEVGKFKNLMDLLAYKERKQVANCLLSQARKQNVTFMDWEQISKFLILLNPLLEDQEDAPKEDLLKDETDQEFSQEQNNVALLLHQCRNDNTDVLCKTYTTVRKYLGKGGERRFAFTLVPLVYCFMRLVTQIYKEKNEDRKLKEEKVFELMNQTLQVLRISHPNVTLSLCLQCALCADRTNQPTYIFSMLSTAFLIYESLKSTDQLDYFKQILSTICVMENMGEEAFSTFSSKACQYSSKLVERPQQCLASSLCSILFWPMQTKMDSCRDDSKALECLQYSLKIVQSCRKPQRLPLFVEVLNVYLYQFEASNDKILVDYINGLLDLIKEHMDDARAESVNHDQTFGNVTEYDFHQVSKYFERTQQYIKWKKEQEPEKWAQIK